MTFYINLGTDHNKRISIRLLQDTSTALSAMKASNTGPPSPPPTSKKPFCQTQKILNVLRLAYLISISVNDSEECGGKESYTK